MSRRLQVLISESEMREIKDLARRQRLTVAEWVRQALRAAKRATPRSEARKKLAVVRAAAQQAFPTSDIDQMLGEIERGYTGPSRDFR